MSYRHVDREAAAYLGERLASLLKVSREMVDLGLESCILLLPELQLKFNDLLLLAQVRDKGAELRKLRVVISGLGHAGLRRS